MPRTLRLSVLLTLILPLLALLPMGKSPVSHASVKSAAESVAPTPQRADISIPLDRPLRFERFSLKDGLSQNSVLAMLQDSKGYLWIGTQDGLNRYDGYAFTVFKHDPDQADSLSSNSITSLLEDREGMLWVGTWGGGLNRYDPSSGRFTRFEPDVNNPGSLNGAIVAALFQDSAGRIWAGTVSGGLNLFDPKSETFTHYPGDVPGADGLRSTSPVSAIQEAPGGQLWVGTGGFGLPGAGLFLFDPASAKFQPVTLGTESGLAPSVENISALRSAPDGVLWIASGGYGLPGAGLLRYDPRTGKTQHYRSRPGDPLSLASNDLLNLYLDSAGVLWIGSYGGGLDRLDTARPEGGFVHARSNPYNPESLSSDQVWGLLQDRSGVMWVGTVNGGLNKLNPQVQQFRLFRNDPGDAHSLGYNAVGPLLQDRAGWIWVGTFGGGLALYQPATGSFMHYKDNEATSNTIMALHEDSHGTLWVGSLNGLAAFSPAGGQFQRLTHDPANPDSLADNNVSVILEDGQKQLWVGTLSGLDVYDRERQRFIHMRIDALGGVVSLFLDREQKLWVGTWGHGLLRLDPQSVSGDQVTVLERFLYDPQNSATLSDDSVWSFYQDQAGSLWVGTGGGLNRFDPLTRTFTHFREKDGLANDSALCILGDAKGQLWVSTNNGISRFDPAAKTFQTYDLSDGLQSNEFDSGSCLKTQAGELFFGGVNGLSAFNPADLRLNSTAPLMVLTAFRIFNETYPVSQTGGTPVRLSYRQDFISFEFAGLDFFAPQKNQYAYKLEGFDKDWVQAGTRRYASYTNLNGGSYVFRVKAANNDGVWNESGIALPIQVTPPIWYSWWFIGGAILFAATAAAAGVRWRIDTLREQARHLEKLVSERTTSLRDSNLQLEEEVEQRKAAEAALAQKAAEELRQSEARFRAMFENAAVGIVLLSLDRQVIESNEAVTQLFGFNPQEFAGKDMREQIHPDDREIDGLLFEELLAGQRTSYQVEKRYLHKDGHTVWANLILSAVRGQNGSALYLLEMLVDIDEQKRIQQELDQQEANYRRLLETRVYERTIELRRANEQLQTEMEQRLKAEQILAHKAAEEAVVAERNRLARDLHDAVTQTLFSASLLADVLPELFNQFPAEGEKRLQELRQLTRGALAEMRTLLVELRPSALIDAPLPDLLRQLGEATMGRARLPVLVSVDGEGELPADVRVMFYRITQEALNNAVKYAHAGSVSINLRLSADAARLTVIDNGAGFDPTVLQPNHFGLRIMRERAEAAGARLSIYSEPGEGTQITVSFTKQALP